MKTEITRKIRETDIGYAYQQQWKHLLTEIQWCKVQHKVIQKSIEIYPIIEVEKIF